jgi:CRP-like cAMP-binding protein
MFFVVESGEASVEVQGEEVATLGPGAAFGEIALIDRRPRTATVTAISDLKTYGLPVFVFRPFVEARPELAWKLLESLADRLAVAEAALLEHLVRKTGILKADPERSANP